LHVVNPFERFQAAVGVLQGGLVERLRLIKTVSIGGALLVGVHVLLGVPARAIPESGVGGVATGEGVQRRLLVVSVSSKARLTLDGREAQLSCVLENRVFAITVVRSGREDRLLEGDASKGRGRLVTSTDARVVLEVSLSAVLSAPGLTGGVFFGDEGRVEACW